MAAPGGAARNHGRWYHRDARRSRHAELEAKQYDEKIRGGNILLSVHTEDSAEQQKAKEIFESHDASDISSGGEAGVRKSA
jgi:hypothetical protein